MTALWVLSRATGLVSLVLLTGVVVLGMAVRRQEGVGRLPRFVVVGLHRNIALLAVLLLVIHIVTVVIDPFVSIGWLSVVVPFVGSYRPFLLGLGALAVDLVLALVGTSLVRHRMSPKLWRAVHLMAYLAWPVALVHGVGIGTDMRGMLGLSIAAACAVAGVGAALWRLSVPKDVPTHERASQALAELRRDRGRRALAGTAPGRRA